MCLLAGETPRRLWNEGIRKEGLVGRRGLDGVWAHFFALRLPPSWTLCPLTMMWVDGCEITVKHPSVFLCSFQAIETDRFSPLQRAAVLQRSSRWGPIGRSTHTHTPDLTFPLNTAVLSDEVVKQLEHDWRSQGCLWKRGGKKNWSALKMSDSTNVRGATFTLLAVSKCSYPDWLAELLSTYN